MVRPKLVQEGAPLYGTGSDVSSAAIRDDVMEVSNENGKDKNLHKVSSLQQAASAVASKKPKRVVSSTCVIGGTNEPTSSPWLQQQKQVRSSSMTYQVGSPPFTSYTSPGGSTHTVLPQDGNMPYIQPMEQDINMEDATTQHNYHQQQSQMDYLPSMSNHYHNNHFSEILPNGFSSYQKAVKSKPTQPAVQTSYVIGGSQEIIPSEPPQKMEGVEDLNEKEPLVVLDGANVAHAYANAMESSSSLQQAATKPEPDAVGIQVATDYFRKAGMRVLVVLPQYWFRSKPRPGDANTSSALMETPHMEALNELKAQGLIVASPPADDDDAYALTISRREESRSLQRNGEGPGFVLSNDMFRDAQQRDPSLKDWLVNGRNETIGPGRISYTFCDMGTMNDHGEKILDFIPNPRHPLVVWAESIHHRSRSV